MIFTEINGLIDMIMAIREGLHNLLRTLDRALTS